MASLNETVTNSQTGHIADHAALRAEFIAKGWTPVPAAYTSSSTQADLAAIHNVLHGRHNTLGGSALPTNLTTSTTSGHLAHHATLHAAYNVRQTTPLQTNLRGWWKADAITGTTTGSAVASWSDSTGTNSLAQATAGQRPIYRNTGTFLPNGKPVLEFTPANSTFLSTTTAVNSGATTRFVVFRQRTSTIGTRQTLFASPTGYELSIDGNVFIGSTSTDAAASTTVVALNTWYVVAVAGDGSSGAAVYVNGAKESATNTPYTASGSGFDFGARGNSTRIFDGYVAELLDYSTILSDADIAAVSSTLGSKYGIAVTVSTTGVPVAVAGYWRSDFTSPTALTPSTGTPATGAEWSGWGQGDPANYGIPALVSAAAEGIAAPPSGDRVVRLRHSGPTSPFGGDYATGEHGEHKLYKQFTLANWPGGAEPTNRNDGTPEDVSGRYICYMYFRSSQMNFVQGFWSNMVQFKEDYTDTLGGFNSNPSWWMGFNCNNPAAPVFNLSCWGGQHSGPTLPLIPLLDQWNKFEYRLYQHNRLECYINDTLFDTGLDSTYRVGRYNYVGQNGTQNSATVKTVAATLGWTFGAGNYTNGGSFPTAASGVYMDLSCVLPLP